jgi:hypothetical protein
MTTTKLTYEEVLRAALMLPMDDIEKMIARLTAERDGLYSGNLPMDGYGRPFSRGLAANLNYNVRNNVDIERRILPEPGGGEDEAACLREELRLREEEIRKIVEEESP